MRRHTSDEAYAINLQSGLITGLHYLIYRIIHDIPHSTAHEVADTPPLDSFQIDSVRPRFAELESARLISYTGERKCKRSGMCVLTWAITGEIATETSFQRKPSRKEIEAELKALKQENAKLRAQSRNGHTSTHGYVRFELRVPGKPGMTFDTRAQACSTDIVDLYCRVIECPADGVKVRRLSGTDPLVP